MDFYLILLYDSDPAKARILVRIVHNGHDERPGVEVIANRDGYAVLAEQAAAFLTDPGRADLLLGPGPDDILRPESARLVFTFDPSLDRRPEP